MDAHDDEADIISSVEIIKDKLYFAVLANRPKSTKNSKFFHIEDEIIYEGFYKDFGPYHICHLYLFCKKLNAKLAKAKSKKVIFYSSNNAHLKLNAAYLMGGYAIIYLKKNPEETRKLLDGYDRNNGKTSIVFRRFLDASADPGLYILILLDVLTGLHVAFEAGFFNFERFNYKEYQYYEKVVNGDLNWIIPGKMLAFSGPHAHTQIKDGYPLHAPEHYHKYFKENNVTTIVRLNKKSYNAKQFTDYGFDHFDLFFVDGSAPSNAIVDKFIDICEDAKGAVAVHCKAGLGRTGTLIACYIMKHYEKFYGRAAIGWLRVCRPGSVIGYQMRFLDLQDMRMDIAGEEYRQKYGPPAKFKRGIYSSPMSDSDHEDMDNADFLESNLDTAEIDNLENVPAVKTALCRLIKSDADVQSSPVKQNKEDFVSLNTIINSNQSSAENKSITQRKTRANTALAKSVYDANLNNYLLSNPNSKFSKSPSIVKVQASYTAAIGNNTITKTPSNHSPSKSPFGPNAPAKLSTKSTVHRANSRNHGPTFWSNFGGASAKVYTRKTTAAPKLSSSNHDNIIIESTSVANITSSITTLTESCNLNGKKHFDSNLNVTCQRGATNTNSLPTKLTESSPKKKIITRTSGVLRKKPLKSEDRLDNAFINNNNSDSERDSDTTLNNISADSLENIPCKMATRREKFRSPEPMEQCAADTKESAEEGLDSQGTKLYKIKATRSKLQMAAQIKKEGIHTRSYSTSPASKKK